MAKKSFLYVALQKENTLYKVNSVALSNDGSIYIFNNFDQHDKVQHKFSYHPTGRGHFTEGQGADKQYIFPKNIISVAKISDPIGLMTITIKNLATKDFDSLKKLTNLNKYKNVIFFKANKYYNLTIMYWLARIDFDISKSSHLYVEVSEVPIDENFKLLIASLNSNNTTELLGLLL